MIKIILNKKKYWLPLKQSEITYRVGKKINEIIDEYDCMSNPEAQKWVLSELCGCSYEEADLVDDMQLAVLIDTHSFFNETIKTPFKQFIKVNGILYQFRDFDKPMTVKEYSDLDLLAIDKYNEELVQMLYKPVKGLFKRISFLFKNHKSWDDMNYFHFQMSLYQYFNWKGDLLNSYNVNADNPEIPEDQKDEEYELTTLEKFGLYHNILELHDNDIKMLHWWMDRDIKELFKFLYYVNLKTITKNAAQ